MLYKQCFLFKYGITHQKRSIFRVLIYIFIAAYYGSCFLFKSYSNYVAYQNILLTQHVILFTHVTGAVCCIPQGQRLCQKVHACVSHRAGQTRRQAYRPHQSRLRKTQRKSDTNGKCTV